MAKIYIDKASGVWGDPADVVIVDIPEEYDLQGFYNKLNELPDTEMIDMGETHGKSIKY